MLPLPLASAVSIKRIVKSYLIRAEEVHKMLSPGFYEFGQCLHCYCNTALSCGSGKCAFRAQYIMNLDGTSVPFVSVCLLTVSCLPSAVFLPMRHFGQCLVWQHCTPAERAVWFRAVVLKVWPGYPQGSLRGFTGSSLQNQSMKHQKLVLPL